MTNKLLTVLQQAKIELKPLKKHYLVKHTDEYIRELYATLLASVVMANGSVTEAEKALLSMLLKSLELNNDVSKYVELATQLDAEQVTDLVKGLDTTEKKQALVFDSLVLARADNLISETQMTVLNELLELLDIHSNYIVLPSFWAKKLLGIEAEPLSKDIIKNNSFRVKSKEKCIVDSVNIKENQFVSSTTHLFNIHNHSGGSGFFATLGSQLEENKFKKNSYISSIKAGFITKVTVDIKKNSGIVKMDTTLCKLLPLPKYSIAWHKLYEEIYLQEKIKET